MKLDMEPPPLPYFCSFSPKLVINSKKIDEKPHLAYM